MLMRQLTRLNYKKQIKVVQSLQIFDLLQLSRQEKELRDFCRLSLLRFGKWKKTMSHTIHLREVPQSRLHGAILRRQAKQAVKLYKSMRHIRTEMFNHYIAALPKLQGFKRLAA